MATSRIAVFIDRDDTIAKDVPYCSSPDQLELFEGVEKAIKKLNDADFLVIIITNQSGIARGYFSEETLNRIHDKLKMMIKREGAYLDAIYYCPHHPDDKCDCRKPKTGLIKQAMNDFNIDIKNSFMIGDKDHDMQLANNMGCIGVKVDNYTEKHPSFSEAVYGILSRKGS